MAQVKKADGTVRNRTDKAYDELGRVRRVVGQNGQESTFTYTKNGNPDEITDVSNNRTTDLDHNVHNELEKITDALSQATEFDYDDQGYRNLVKDSNVHSTRFKIDGFGQVVEIDSPDSPDQASEEKSAG